jgi:uncharacterized protein YggE
VLKGYIARRSTRLECAPDGEGLTHLVASCARDGVSVRGPQWRLSPAAPGWTELRSQAAADACQRANAYTAGLGMSVGRVCFQQPIRGCIIAFTSTCWCTV